MDEKDDSDPSLARKTAIRTRARADNDYLIDEVQAKRSRTDSEPSILDWTLSGSDLEQIFDEPCQEVRQEGTRSNLDVSQTGSSIDHGLSTSQREQSLDDISDEILKEIFDDEEDPSLARKTAIRTRPRADNDDLIDEVQSKRSRTESEPSVLDWTLSDHDLEQIFDEQREEVHLEVSQTESSIRQELSTSQRQQSLDDISDEMLNKIFDNEEDQRKLQMRKHSQKPSIEELPAELLEPIFCYLPINDLINNCSLVCDRFYKLISRKKYLFWKKTYHRYIRHDPGATVFVQATRQAITAGRPLGIEQLIEYMGKECTLRDDELKEAQHRLQSHPLNDSAVNVLKKVLHDGQEGLNSLVAVMILISDTVESMSKSIDLLMAEPRTAVYWTEYLYRLLAMLWSYKCASIPQAGRIHYQLKYALYTYECGGYYTVGNDGQARSVGDRSKKSLTPEQCRIIAYDLRPKDIVRIVAFAGTGKTTTLEEYCRARKQLKFLVLFFNKDAAEEAAKRFPWNATCCNIHSFVVRQKYGKIYGKKIGDFLPSTYSLCKLLGDALEKSLDLYLEAALIQATLNNYFASDYDEITTLLVPCTWQEFDTTADEFVTRRISYDLKLKIVKFTETTWDAMKDDKNTEIMMHHDGYLKLYQLSKERITGYDVLMVDEAQDCTPAILSIVMEQRHMPKILVGDVHQQIYSFRGAVNALKTLPFTKSFYLTQSFRFGPEIAYVANSWMQSILGEERKFLIGTKKTSRLDGVRVGQVAILCRTNQFVFTESLEIAQRERGACLLVGNISKPFDFRPLEALCRLYSGHKWTSKSDHYYLKFKSFGDAKWRARARNDVNLQWMITVVEKHKEKTIDLINTIKSCLVMNPEEAQFIVTTAHKSKGLEFDTVQLSSDFMADPDDPNVQLEGDEMNCVYVAMTRAKTSLILNETVYKILTRRCTSMFSWPIFRQDDAKCTKCGRIFTGSTFLTRKSLAVVCGKQVVRMKQQEVCKQCIDGMIREDQKWQHKFYINQSAHHPVTVIDGCIRDCHFYSPLLG